MLKLHNNLHRGNLSSPSNWKRIKQILPFLKSTSSAIWLFPILLMLINLSFRRPTTSQSSDTMQGHSTDWVEILQLETGRNCCTWDRQALSPWSTAATEDVMNLYFSAIFMTQGQKSQSRKSNGTVQCGAQELEATPPQPSTHLPSAAPPPGWTSPLLVLGWYHVTTPDSRLLKSLATWRGAPFLPLDRRKGEGRAGTFLYRLPFRSRSTLLLKMTQEICDFLTF